LPAVIGPIVAAIESGSIIGSILTAVITTGLGFVAQVLFAPDVPEAPKPQDIKTVIRASVSPRRRHYGRVLCGGSLAMLRPYNGDLFGVLMLGQGPFYGFVKWYLDDTPIEINSEGWVSSDPYDGDFVKIISHPGGNDQVAISMLVNEFPGWTNDHRLLGIAIAGYKLQGVDPEDVAEFYPNQANTKISVVADTYAEVLDVRLGTLGFTANAALCLRDYLVNKDGARVPASLIDTASFAAAADVCDEDVPLKGGGTVKRYHLGLTYELTEQPIGVLNRFLTVQDGRLYLTGEGKIALLSGKWVDPSVTIKDEHILDFHFSAGNGPFREANEVIVKYTQVEADYAEATCDPWRNEAAVSELGDVRSMERQIYEAQTHSLARRLAKITERRANPEWTGWIQTTLYGLKAFDQRWVNLQLSILGIDDTFEIISWLLDPSTMTVTIELQTMHEEAYDWDAESEEGTAPTVEPRDGKTSIPGPPIGTVELELRLQTISQEGELVRVYTLFLSWPPKPAAGLRVEAELTKYPSASWQSLPTQRETDNLETGPVERGVSYLARVRYVSVATKSEWGYSEVIDVPAVIPPDP
jgi:hypothetical protein